MRRTTVGFMLSALLAVFVMAAPRQDKGDAIVTVEGQVVCSSCWFEADRNVTAYGTAGDLQCAADCAKAGKMQAIAVRGVAAHPHGSLRPVHNCDGKAAPPDGRDRRPGFPLLRYRSAELSLGSPLSLRRRPVFSTEIEPPQHRSEPGIRSQRFDVGVDVSEGNDGIPFLDRRIQTLKRPVEIPEDAPEHS